MSPRPGRPGMSTGKPALYPTTHCRGVMERRSITWAEIVDIVKNAQVVYCSAERYGRDLRVMQKDELAVVVAPDGAVVTVLLRRPEQWTDEDARKRGKS